MVGNANAANHTVIQQRPILYLIVFTYRSIMTVPIAQSQKLAINTAIKAPTH